MTSKRFDLTGRVAIITGAGRGIGRSIALGLAEHGADIVLCSRTEAQLLQVAQEIQNLGQKALPRTVDISQVAQFDGLVVDTIKTFGHINILVNNAGGGTIVPVLEVDEKEWDLGMGTNTKGPFFLCQKVGKVMIQQGRGGSIINVTSEVAEQKVERLPLGAYCPSKAALHNITKMLAREWGKYQIRVNSLAPCFVKTAVNESLMADKEWYENKLKDVPLGRHSEPEDLVGAAIFLASDASGYITGTTILVDGGYTT
jgi:NAD(P)-dependent dehydrogenase (short-subunit alcohol dehydrogenase family)